MTIFEILDERVGDKTFSQVTRAYYKKRIEKEDIQGTRISVGTLYRDGVPIKQLTIKRTSNECIT